MYNFFFSDYPRNHVKMFMIELVVNCKCEHVLLHG